MSGQRQKYFLILVTLALVITPLRGAFAMPAADISSHCDQMQDAGSPQTRMAGLQFSLADDSDSECYQGCAGDCCGEACNTCAHSAIAIPGFIATSADVHFSQPKTTASYGVAVQLVHPPFRPPISLHS